MKKTKIHVGVTIFAAATVLTVCLLRGFSPAHTALILIVTIAAAYVLSGVCVGLVMALFFKPVKAEAETGEQANENNDASADETAAAETEVE